MADTSIQPRSLPFAPQTRPCPACAAINTQRLEYPSKLAHAEVFQCVDCGHVWAMPEKQAN
jgi:Zn ribbon nucleic-acid-binding protein